MGNKLTREEQETIVIFNELDKTAKISTFNGSLIRKLSALCESRPDDCTGTKVNEIGEAFFTVPKRYIKVNATRILSEEQLAISRESGRLLYEKSRNSTATADDSEEDC